MTVLRYQKTEITKYLACACSPGITIGFTLLVLGIIWFNNDPIPACNPPLAFPPLVSYLWNKCMILSIVLTLMAYSAALVVLNVATRRLRSLPSTNPKYVIFKVQQKVTKSCAVIILAFLLTWCFCHVSMYFVSILGFSAEVLDVYKTLMVIPGMLCYAQNYYIYFGTSITYREAFIYQMRAVLRCRLRACIQKNNSVLATRNCVQTISERS
ncbi:hypothetical protein L596_026497 [Steinernema carpocapsae]|uniref:G-protein coupled receptors family 1 profile domain-containing protein n=1 Tax=Steinernema carpocapsae TaxID=34508 RepID=A0A4U5M2J5_STECR|nr:hypothetical protein L596_026497 [Steinernema carpocapsae]